MQHTEQITLTPVEIELIEFIRTESPSTLYEAQTLVLQFALSSRANPDDPPGMSRDSCDKLYFYIGLMGKFSRLSQKENEEAH